MPINCFKYNGLYVSSKRYHTAAKQSAAAFFDSSFNYIKQNSQLVVSLDSLSQGAKRFPNPHPANSATAHYLQIDPSNNIITFQNDDENNNSTNITVHNLKNPINIVLPFSQEHVIFTSNNANYQHVTKKLPAVNVSQVFVSTNHLANKLQPNHIQKQSLHTSTKNAILEKSEKQLSSSGSSPTLVAVEEHDKIKYFEPVVEPASEQSDATFLTQQTLEIERAFKSGQYEKINSIFMAIRRNNIIPSREVYYRVLTSISRRNIDDTLDDQLSALLNVYQDMIANKLKPNTAIYSTVLSKLLESSIRAACVPYLSVNGEDFFKIAIDIFNASNSSHIQNFESHITDKILTGINLYPGLANASVIVNTLQQQSSFVKNHIYYASLINFCKFNNESKTAIKLYEEFKQETINNEDLTSNQFVIYSSFISTLVHTNEIALATKFLDKILNSIKNYENYESKITLLLSSYLITLSKQNHPKALEIWTQFNKIDWIPEFSYEFYMNLLNDSLYYSYETSTKLYNYMTALPRIVQHEYDINTVLITPPKTESLSKFLMMAIANDDKSTVLKMIKESFVRESSFDFEVYPSLFQYLNNEDLSLKIINSHGLVLKNGFDFLTHLTSSIPNLPIFEISTTNFFKKLISEFSIEKEQLNFYGFYQVFKSVFHVNVDDINKKEMIELISPLIIEFYDLNNFYHQFNTSEMHTFKDDLTNYFTGLIKHSDKIDELSTTASEAIDLIKNL